MIIAAQPPAAFVAEAPANTASTTFAQNDNDVVVSVSRVSSSVQSPTMSGILKPDFSKVGQPFIALSVALILCSIGVIAFESFTGRLLVNGWVVLAVIVGSIGWWRTAVLVRRDLMRQA